MWGQKEEEEEQKEEEEQHEEEEQKEEGVCVFAQSRGNEWTGNLL